MRCPNCNHELSRVISYGGWAFDEEAGILREQSDITWTPAEAKLIIILLEAQGRPVDRVTLLDGVAKKANISRKSCLIDVYVCRIRDKVPALIGTYRRQGYYAMEKE